jgi:16S rRNA (guanine966-N2)-methyltransferase
VNLRIVAGHWRGRRLTTPGQAQGIRPTSDRLREALFSILVGRFEDELFVDLFAGTGAVGLEAASRGAGRVVLVEKSREAQNICRANIKALGAQSLVELRCASAGSPGVLEKAAVVFADPPYAGSPQQSLAALLGCAVADAGCWCLELSADAAQPQLPVGVATVLDRVYGGSRLIIYERAAP